MRPSDTWVKNMVVTADLLNTINGGMSKPSYKMSRKDDHYELDVITPGIDGQQLKVEIHNRFISIFHHLSYVSPDHSLQEEGAPNIIHLMPIPFDVELDSIHAVYGGKHLKVLMPFNELAEGYHRSVEIDTI